jgi:ABC-type lipoprotein export system ATPase subunit
MSRFWSSWYRRCLAQERSTAYYRGVPRPPEIRRIILHAVVPAFPRRPDSGVWGRDISMERGETLLVTGASGSGKSSMLSFVTGFRSDYAGSIDVGGRAAAALRDSERSAALIWEMAVVYQDLKLIDGLTARENVEVKRLLAPHRTAGDAERMADRLGVRRVFDDPVGTLSRGEQQRVAVIRALVQPFSFIFLDEPFSHLDAASAREARALIEEERFSRGAALVLLDLDDASAFSSARRLAI